MPTGYTEGIISGEIKTFSEFAKRCMRAFGATIHMRDNNLNECYKPRTPSKYHPERIEELQNELKLLLNSNDEKLFKDETGKLEKERKYHEKEIKKAIINRNKLSSLLGEIRKWGPPSKDHYGFKSFMLEQVEKTIDFDCNTDYHIEKKEEISEKLSNFNIDEIREERKKSIEGDIAYHQKEYIEELERCAESNKWVEEILKTI